MSACIGCDSELPEGARFCPNCGQRAPDSPRDQERHSRIAASTPSTLVQKIKDTELSGERRMVTAIFADVVGSTALMESIDPEDWTAIVTVAFELMSQAVYRYEGTIAQLQGDAMVAFFGAPVAHEDDPERAVRAASDMVSDIQEYRDQLRESQGIDFQIRAGINTGWVMVGKVGTDLRYEYTALGDAMNVAARMEAAARPGTVLITHDTYRFVSGAFDVEDLGSLPVKGKSRPVRAYEVIRARAAPASMRGVAGLRSPMVGRDRDLGLLKGLLGRLGEGSGLAACLIGEAGIGKTRLLSEFKASAVTSGDDLRWVEGRGLSYGRNFAYHLVRDLVLSCIGATPSSTSGEVSEALSAALSSLTEEDRTNGHRFLSHMLGLPIAESDTREIESMNPENLQTRYVGGLKWLLNALTSGGPLVMVLEDVHWADPVSVQLLGQMIAFARPLPVMTCLVTRPDRDAAGWHLVTTARDVFGEDMTEVELTPLADDDSGKLMASLLEIESLPEKVRTRILSTAEGNPFFLEELIKVLIDRGVIVREGPNWVATTEVEKVQIPDTLRGLLLARIDRLGEDVRYSLKVASVIGRQFPTRVLERVLEGSE